MTSVDYLNAVRGILDHLQKTQLPAVDRAADLVVDSLLHQGIVRCAAIGHANEADFINRAGGLAALQPFSFSFTTNDPGPECYRDRPREQPFERDLESVRCALKAANVRSGDVMVLGSVSGRNRYPVELALSCRALGVKVIAFTSLAYTARVSSLHPSGKKLGDVADVVIDNGAPYGDAAVNIPGYEVQLLPVSGVAMTVTGWMIWGRVMEKMAAAGTPPSVYMSVNREGGQEYYNQSKAQYNQRGF